MSISPNDPRWARNQMIGWTVFSTSAIGTVISGLLTGSRILAICGFGSVLVGVLLALNAALTWRAKR